MVKKESPHKNRNNKEGTVSGGAELSSVRAQGTIAAVLAIKPQVCTLVSKQVG
jgi:hypothetical protein